MEVWKICTVLLFLRINTGVLAAPCIDDTPIGSPNPSSDSNAGPETGYVTHMIDSTGDTAYELTCCGVIKTIDFVTDQAGTINLQVWDLTTGTTYSLVSNTAITAVSGLNSAVPIGASIESGFRYGWHSNPQILKHKAAGSSSPEQVDRFVSTSTTTVGSTLDWSTADQKGETYSPALKLYLGPGNLPTLTSSAGMSVTLNTADAVNTFITTLTAADGDPADTLTTTMTTVNTDYTFTTATATTSTITTAASLAGISRTVTLTFQVADQCLNLGTLTVTLNIVNDPPTVTMVASDNLSEDTTAKTLIRQITATDTVDAVVCTMAASVDPTFPFEVDVIPGTTDYGVYSSAAPGFSYSTKNSYDLLVECVDIDPANVVQRKYTVFLLKNAAPAVTNVPGFIFVSTSTASLSSVFTVTATDAEGDTIEYAITCPNDPTCPFSIGQYTGVTTLTSDLTTSSVTGYDVYVTVNDGRTASDTVVLSILISDINDNVTIQNLPLTANYPIIENTGASTAFFTVTSSDQDTSQTLTYSMTSTGTGLTYFLIDPSTGVISTTLSTTNYETLNTAGETSFTLSVSVTDGIHTDTQTLEIDVIDINEAPVFSQTSYSLSTNEGSANTMIGTPAFNVIDPDTGDSQIFDMNCGNGYFYMDSTSGQVKFQADYDVDAGLPTSVTCSLTVTDGGGLTDTALLYISVANTNDHTPSFSPSAYTFYVSYYAGTGTVLGTLTATDSDSGSFGNLLYTLDQTNVADEYFTIDGSTGVVSLAQSLEQFGYGTTVTITGLVYDGGALEDTTSITIIASDTTTASTAAVTQRYRKFAEDSRNMPWLVFSLIIVAIIIGFLGWVIFTCRGQNGLAETLKTCRRRQFRPRLWQRRGPKPPLEPQAKNITIRRPPPMKVQQQWRTGQEGAPPGTEVTYSTSYL